MTETIYTNRTAIISPTNPTWNDHTRQIAEDGELALVGFAWPESLRYRMIKSMIFYAYGGHCPEIYAVLEDWDAQSVTYATAPKYDSIGRGMLMYEINSSWNWTFKSDGSARKEALQLRYGALLKPKYNGQVHTSLSANRPYAVVEFYDQNASGEITGMSPASGYVPKNAVNTFSWAITARDICIGEIRQTSATFRWRAAAGSAVNEIPCGTETQCTLMASTFSSDAVEWSVEASLSNGETVSTGWMMLTTTEETSTAVAVEPSGIVVDGTGTVRLTWRHEIGTGTPQTSASLQSSRDGVYWSELATVTGPETHADFSGGTFAAGTHYWRVRTYNTDGAAGAWSEPAQFVSISAPQRPAVTLTEISPRPAISWQAADQQAYEAEVSGITGSGAVYGTAHTWRSLRYLDDGVHRLRVRVQNEFGLWSEWGEADATIANTPDAPIVLTAEGGREPALAWTTDGEYDCYIVRRNGKDVARTTERTFRDRGGIGACTYQIRGGFDGNGRYTLSQRVTVSALPEVITICDEESGAWLDLPTSEAQLRMASVQKGITMQLVHLTGLDFPIAERSGSQDKTLTVTCAFRSGDERCEMLETMIGKRVRVKTPQGDSAAGVLQTLKKTADKILTRYTFEVRQLWEKEEIDL